MPFLLSLSLVSLKKRSAFETEVGYTTSMLKSFCSGNLYAKKVTSKSDSVHSNLTNQSVVLLGWFLQLEWKQCTIKWNLLEVDSMLKASLTLGVIGGGRIEVVWGAAGPGDTESLLSPNTFSTWLFGLWGRSGLIWKQEKKTGRIKN